MRLWKKIFVSVYNNNGIMATHALIYKIYGYTQNL